MNAPDTSVLVAAFARWHERHDQARAAVQDSSVLIGHVAVETFSVLTRLPPPRRAAPGLVVEFVSHHFPDPPVVLDRGGYRLLLSTGVEQRISGSAIYDALIAATAASHGATLLTLDRRAIAVYGAMGADHRLVS